MILDARLSVEGDAALRTCEIARLAEGLGLRAIWTGENKHDHFLPLAVAAEATTTLELGTAVAIAFSRSPMVIARTAWDLQRRSRGRFMLGLGTQVKAHIVRRFGRTWDRPAARLRDYALALRAIWATFQQNEPLRYEGEFYRLSLMVPTFNPGPIADPVIPIWVSGIGQAMARSAGGYADGFRVHPFHGRLYLDEVLRPELAAGARAEQRDAAAVAMSSSVFLISSDDPAERDAHRAAARERVAFYGSTPSYRAVLEVHGWEGVGDRLGELARERRWADMPALVTDSMLEAFAVEAAPHEIAAALDERYSGALDRVSPFEFLLPENAARWRAFPEA